MVSLFLGLALVDDDGFVDYHGNVMRTFCTVAESRLEAVRKIQKKFHQEFGFEPQRICLCELSELDGYVILLQPVDNKE
jgi:hypothetical protein